MFLFLSKILPLLIYPLGLSCILSLIALTVWWKRPRLARGLVGAVLTLLLLGGNSWVVNVIVRSLESQNLPTDLPKAGAIVILGGGIDAALPPRPGFNLNEAGDRVPYGAKLYREGKAPLIIASGGRIPWSNGGSVRGEGESSDTAQFLEMMGVPKSAILEEPDSLNTYENAVNVKKILDAHGIHRILLVTSAWHMPRSLLIFKKQGIDAIAAPTDFLAPQPAPESFSPEGIALSLLPDSGNLDRLTRVLKEYVGLVVYRLKGWL
jgi:uncharacterized SAM-binding protein YcdF (DUF218 family)